MEHLSQLTPRQEKNRHHAATLTLTCLLGLVLSLGYNVWPSPRTVVIVTATVIIWGAMAIVRSVVIELGVRRAVAPSEQALEHRGRGVLRRHFGVVFLEDQD